MNRLACSGASAALLLLLASGCGTTAPTAHEKPAVSREQQARDARACTEVEAVLGHIRAATVGMLTIRPFDATVSRRLAEQARSLGEQGADATPEIRSAVRATATSFTAVADAMRTGKRETLDKAVADSRVAYKALKKACSL